MSQTTGPLGSVQTWRLKLVRARNVTIRTDPSIRQPYRARFEGAPPKVLVQAGVVTVDVGVRRLPRGRRASEITLNPSMPWGIDAPKDLWELRADLTALHLLGVEVDGGIADAEMTLPRPSGTVRLRFGGGGADVNIHRPTGSAARLNVRGGASKVRFDDQFYKAVGGEASWKTADFERATDRYDIDFAQGLRNVVVDAVEVAPPSQRLLATVLFTDIVASTERARQVGDRRWRELLDLHDQMARKTVEREGGRLIKSTGDGILAVFDGPGPGIRAAVALRDELRERGLEIRGGLHTGEVEFRGADVGGIAIHIGARIMGEAAPGEVLVSRTVRDLVAGSDYTLEDRGTHALKGVGDEWQVFAVR